MDFLDEDENVKAMRDTARRVGLTDVLMLAVASEQLTEAKRLIWRALRLLGVPDDRRAER
jgi:hypothetical protein